MDKDSIEKCILEVLPNLSIDSCKLLMEKLDSIGVETVGDLNLIREVEMIGILKPMQVRKLLLAWSPPPASINGILHWRCYKMIFLEYIWNYLRHRNQIFHEDRPQGSTSSRP